MQAQMNGLSGGDKWMRGPVDAANERLADGFGPARSAGSAGQALAGTLVFWLASAGRCVLFVLSAQSEFFVEKSMVAMIHSNVLRRQASYQPHQRYDMAWRHWPMGSDVRMSVLLPLSMMMRWLIK